MGCYGSTFYATPNIDQLAEKGMRFTQSYSASAVCSPTRASILTGKHPARLHLTDWIGPDEWRPKGKMKTPEFKQELVHSEKTLAETLNENGYQTWFFGKWHLGDKPYYPEHQGFDINLGGTSGGAPPSYFYPYERANWEGTGWETKLHAFAEGEKGEYLTDRLTDEALQYLEKKRDQPFFLYMSHYAVHKPFQSKEELSKKYAAKAENMSDKFIQDSHGEYSRAVQNHPVYAGMVQSVDESVGRILDKLDELNLSDNTIVIFTSDNGGLSTAGFESEGGWLRKDQIVTSVLPLRTGKGWYYEGGIRIPTIVHWPGKTKPGSESGEMIISTDFYPTILDMVNIPQMPEQHMDGLSLKEHLANNKKLDRETLCWHYPHYHNLGQDPASAIRKGDYKLIHFLEDDYVELYVLKIRREVKVI